MTKSLRYVTGSNAPGYMPEEEPRGPWNSWRDACADIASMIDDDSESTMESAAQGRDDSVMIDTIQAQAEITAAQERPTLRELADGLDVVFMGRAYFIRPADESDIAPEGWRYAESSVEAAAPALTSAAGYSYDAPRATLRGPSGAPLVTLERARDYDAPGPVHTITSQELDRFARQIVQALNAPPAPQFERVQLEALQRRAEIETIYDYAEDLADIVDSLLAYALSSCAPHVVQAMSLEQARALKVGQRVQVWAEILVTDEDDEERQTALGETAQVTQVRTLPAPQGYAVTVDFLEGGYATFDEGDAAPQFPFSRA